MAGDEERQGERARQGRRDPARNSPREPVTIEGAATDVTTPETVAPAAEAASVDPATGSPPWGRDTADTVAAATPVEPDVAGVPPLSQPEAVDGTSESGRSSAAAMPRADEVERAAERGRSNFATAMAVAIVVMAGAIIYLFYQTSSAAPDRSGDIASLNARLNALEARPTPDTSGIADQARSAQGTATQARGTATQARDAAAQAQAAVAALTKRLDGMTPPPAPPNLQPQVADLQGSLSDVRKSLAALQSTVAALPRPDIAGIETRFGDINTRLSSLQSAVSGIPHIDLGPLTAKVDGLEGRLKPLETDVQAAQSPERVAERKAAPIAVTAQAVVEAIAAGQAFPREFRALQVLGVDPAKLAPLQVVAANGAPTLAELQDDLSQIRARVVSDGAPAPSGSYMDRLMAGATNLVQVRPLGSVVGDTPAAIVARMNEEIAGEDLSAALADWQKLPEASRAASKSLPERIKLRLDAETAARDIAANAIGTMAEPRG